MSNPLHYRPLLSPRRLRLRRDRLRIETDIENVVVAGEAGQHRIAQVFSDDAERDAGILRHRHRGPVDLGGDDLLVDTGLHHRDAEGDFDARRRTSRTRDDAALNADAGDDLTRRSPAVARGP